MIRYKHIHFTYTPEQSVVVFNENEEPKDEKPYYKRRTEGQSWGDFYHSEWQSQSITLTMDDVEAEKVKAYISEPITIFEEDYAKGILVNCIEIKCSSCNHVLGTELKKGCATHCPDGDNYYKAVFKEPVKEGKKCCKIINNVKQCNLSCCKVDNPHLKPEQKESEMPTIGHHKLPDEHYLNSDNDEQKEEGDKWISVNDRLPEKEGRYIVTKIYDKEHSTTAYFTGSVFENYDGYRVTHWQPLPNPPKQ